VLRLFKSLRAEHPDSLESEVLALMLARERIKAVMLYRAQTGVGLKEARDAVDALAAKHGIRPKRVGCVVMVLAMVGVVIVVSTIILLGLWVFLSG
jgi:ribosomal protein L7/L12